mgnify:CR=1 FL=1
MLEMKHLTKSLGHKIILKDVSGSFDTGINVLLGPNGAGKTTLMRCLTQIYTLDKGEIIYNGLNITKTKNYLNQVGYLPQKFGMFRDLTVYEMFELLAGIKGIYSTQLSQEINYCIEQVNLCDKLDNKVSTLSGGMIRRLGVAQALLGNPEVVILDEPTAGLDPEERLRFKLLISDIGNKKTVIISTHIVSDIEENCDNIAIISDGHIDTIGSCNEIRNMGNGKVFLVPTAETKNIKTPFFIQNKCEYDGRAMLRILSSVKLPYMETNPSLEDGYMCIQKRI